MLENEKMNISKSFDESFFPVSRAFFVSLRIYMVRLRQI